MLISIPFLPFPETASALSATSVECPVQFLIGIIAMSMQMESGEIEMKDQNCRPILFVSSDREPFLFCRNGLTVYEKEDLSKLVSGISEALISLLRRIIRHTHLKNLASCLWLMCRTLP
jgi:hypothetical protein